MMIPRLLRVQQMHCNVKMIQRTMAGHSKWANIRHIKAQKDGEKAALFTRISRQIRLAIQEGGISDPALNSTLRSVIDEALRKNMPAASIQSTIKKCQQNKTELKRYVLQLRFKQKVFVICTLFTDNFALVKQEMATILRKNGAAYTDVQHLFEDIGVVETTLDDSSSLGSNLEERVTEDAIECGAEDVEIVNSSAGLINFFCRPIEINAVRKAIESKGYKIDNSNHIYMAKNTIVLTEDELKSYHVFVDKLQNLSGVEDIFDNIQRGES